MFRSVLANQRGGEIMKKQIAGTRILASIRDRIAKGESEDPTGWLVFVNFGS